MRPFVPFTLLFASLVTRAGTASNRDLTREGDPPPCAPVSALSVGVSAFPALPDRMQLRFADDDARAFLDVLASGSPCPLPVERQTLLLDQEATTGQVRAALQGVLAGARPGARVVIFISTHGVVTDDQGYLALSDTSLSEDGLRLIDGLPLSELEVLIRQSPAGEVLVFLDACQSGALGRAAFPSSSAERAPTLPDTLTPSRQVFLQASAGASQLSAELPTQCGGHGYYTCALLQAMEGAADDDGDGRITLGELQTWVQSWVWVASQREQAPQTVGSYTHDLTFMTVAEHPRFWIRQGPRVPASDAAHVTVIAGHVEVWMVDSAGRSVSFGAVHAGEYRVQAQFDGGATWSTPLSLAPGDRVSLTCDETLQDCIIQ